MNELNRIQVIKNKINLIGFSIKQILFVFLILHYTKLIYLVGDFWKIALSPLKVNIPDRLAYLVIYKIPVSSQLFRYTFYWLTLLTPLLIPFLIVNLQKKQKEMNSSQKLNQLLYLVSKLKQKDEI